MSAKTLAESFADAFASDARLRDNAEAGSIRDAKIDRATSSLNLVVEFEKYLTMAELDELVAAIRGLFGNQVKVNLQVSGMPENPAKATAKGGAKNDGAKPDRVHRVSEKKVLGGEGYFHDTTPLGELTHEMNNVTVRGIVRDMSAREVKNDSMLVSFLLTDYVNAIDCKRFFIKEDYNEKIKDKLVGSTVILRGSYVLDSYSNQLVLNVHNLAYDKEELEVDEETKALWNSALLGTPFTTEKQTLDTLSYRMKYDVPTESVAFDAEIISVDAHDIRGDRTSLQFHMTDYKGYVTVRATVPKSLTLERAAEYQPGKVLAVCGDVVDADFYPERVVYAKALLPSSLPPRERRKDKAERKRIELHAHTTMSEMDAICSPKELVMQAYNWGHKAVAVTDHGVVQGFPDASDTLEKKIAAKEKERKEAAEAAGEEYTPFKVIYGLEAYLVDDRSPAVFTPDGDFGPTDITGSLSDECVVFDIETTGLNKRLDRIIEIGAVRVANGEIQDSFSCFIDPEKPLSARTTELTSITDEDVRGQGNIAHWLPRFLEWVGSANLVAHNATFDVGFICEKARELGIPEPKCMVLDTMQLCRGLYDLKKYTLDHICKSIGINLTKHHRAVYDAQATAEIYLACVRKLKEAEIFALSNVNDYIFEHTDPRYQKAYHTILLVKNKVGLKNLYKLVSFAHLKHFNRTPRVTRSEIDAHREGLIISSACQAGEVFQAILEGESDERLRRLVSWYDYLEIQPIANNAFLKEDDKAHVSTDEDLRDLNRRVIELGQKYNKPVVATGDVHFTDPEDAIYRDIILYSKGMDDGDGAAPLYFKTTDEMLEEFSYLGKELAEEVVIDAPARIAEQIESILPVPKGQFAPVIEGAAEELKTTVYNKAKSLYGDPLPDIVEQRLDKEVTSIINNGFSTLYILARRLVQHSVGDGYIVGSRGSVGSSLVATFSGITEVNPLPAHYYCEDCHYAEFDNEILRANKGASGVDLPDLNCPHCGKVMKKDGHDIPFEVFLGFNGDKEPDIDLNFSGEYQPRAHAYVEEMFGKDHVYRAGTLAALKDKTAFGYVKKYLEGHQQTASNAEIAYLSSRLTGVKRTTGQHPGGQIVVPQGYEIYDFCPIQYPANDESSGVITTHFTYDQLHGRLLKLDILGHDDPTMLRMLKDLTGLEPTEIPLDDPEVMSLFLNTDSLHVSPEELGSPVGTFGVPEFGTNFVRGMLVDTKPQNFSDLVRISGLSHGTDVWNNNAKDYVSSGLVKISQCICTREDIMNGLIYRGMEKNLAFKIMETVRKGSKSGGLKPDQVEAMKAIGVEDWYLESCKKIQYLFPKAHAVAYVTMSLRVAYYKVHYPQAYYAAYFTIRADDFDYEMMAQGLKTAQAAMKSLGEKDDRSDKEDDLITELQMILEFYLRGLEFLPISLTESDWRNFRIIDGKLLPPFNSISGMGEAAAQSIVEARDQAPFETVEDFAVRTRVNRSTIDIMRRLGLFDGMQETDQLSLF